MKHRLIQSLADIIIIMTIMALFPLIICAIWLDPVGFWVRLLITDFMFFSFGMVLHNLFEDHCGTA